MKRNSSTEVISIVNQTLKDLAEDVSETASVEVFVKSSLAPFP